MPTYVSPSKVFADVHPSFVEVLCSDDNMPNLMNVFRKISATEISPHESDIFNFAKHFAISEIKAVIIGQDPYPNIDHAHGLSFSSLSDKVPASLKNIYKCLIESGHINDMPASSNLLAWAKQGVLLLNTSLTTNKGVAGAHVKLWKPVTQALIEAIDKQDKPVCYMLWGGHAKKMSKFIKSKKALILESSHPSPLSQNRLADKDKFTHCNHFTMTNDFLIENGVSPIVWDPTPNHVIYTDGSVVNNGKITARGGYSAIFTEGVFRGAQLYGKLTTEAYYGLMGDIILWPTSPRAEGLAIIVALEKILKFGVWNRITVITDSKFWVDVDTKYYDKWMANKYQPIDTHKNPDLLLRFGKVREAFKGCLEIKHIKAHTNNKDYGSVMNDLCDKKAKEARECSEYGDFETTIDLSKYES